MNKLHEHVYMHTTADGLNVGCVANEDGVVSIDLPLQPDEAVQWVTQIKTLSPKPLRVIIFTAPDRVNSDALRALAPHLGAFSLPSIIQDVGFNQLYAALEASQPRLLEPLSPVQLRERAVLPDMTFSDAATFTLSANHPVRIDIASAGGYGAGGSSVSIRDTGILFAGWMVSSNQPPWASGTGAPMDAWIARLTPLRRNRKIKLIVPAAGPVGDLSMAARTQDYLKAASAGVKKLVRQHKPRESVGALAHELAVFYQPSSASADVVLAAGIAERVQQSLERMYDELMTAQTAAETEPAPEV